MEGGGSGEGVGGSVASWRDEEPVERPTAGEDTLKRVHQGEVEAPWGTEGCRRRGLDGGRVGSPGDTAPAWQGGAVKEEAKSCGAEAGCVRRCAA